MTETATGGAIELRYELDAPPEKVWHAVTVPALRERWLPGQDLACAEPVEITPGRDVSYRMRESAPPFLESTVTFHVEPGSPGRTCLRIVHRLADPGIAPAAANGNAPSLLLAA